MLVDTWLGSAVRRERRAQGLTQRELADRLGISLGAIRDVEQGRTLSANHRLTAFLHAARLRLAVLGPLEATRSGTQVDLGPPAQRTILAMLALTPGQWLHRDQLAAALRPGGGAASIHTYVSRLRRVLDPAHPRRGNDGPLQHDQGHYRLRLDPDQLDLLAWRDALGTAEETGDRAAYQRALQLWRGDPLAAIAQLDDYPPLAALRRERAAAIEEYAALCAQHGDPQAAIGYLEDLVRADPFHETAHALLIEALTATGQFGLARRTYEALATRLADELHVGPGPALRRAYERLNGGSAPVRQRGIASGRPEAWFDRGVPHLLALAGLAADDRLAPLCGELALLLNKHLYYAGDFDNLRIVHETALTVAIDTHRAPLLNNLGVVEHHQSQTEQAIERFEQALAAAQYIGDAEQTAEALDNLGLALERQGHTADAIDHHTEALAIAASNSDRRRAATIRSNLAVALHRVGRLDEALRHQRQALAIARQDRDAWNESRRLASLGRLLADLGRFSAAAAHQREAIQGVRQIGDLTMEAANLCDLSTTYRLAGREDLALTTLRDAVPKLRATSNHHHLAYALGVLADLGAEVPGPPLH